MASLNRCRVADLDVGPIGTDVSKRKDMGATSCVMPCDGATLPKFSRLRMMPCCRPLHGPQTNYDFGLVKSLIAGQLSCMPKGESRSLTCVYTDDATIAVAVAQAMDANIHAYTFRDAPYVSPDEVLYNPKTITIAMINSTTKFMTILKLLFRAIYSLYFLFTDTIKT